MMESSDKTWSSGGGNGKPLQCSYLENEKAAVNGVEKLSIKAHLILAIFIYSFKNHLLSTTMLGTVGVLEYNYNQNRQTSLLSWSPYSDVGVKRR